MKDVYEETYAEKAKRCIDAARTEADVQPDEMPCGLQTALERVLAITLEAQEINYKGKLTRAGYVIVPVEPDIKEIKLTIESPDIILGQDASQKIWRKFLRAATEADNG